MSYKRLNQRLAQHAYDRFQAVLSHGITIEQIASRLRVSEKAVSKLSDINTMDQLSSGFIRQFIEYDWPHVIKPNIQRPYGACPVKKITGRRGFVCNDTDRRQASKSLQEALDKGIQKARIALALGCSEGSLDNVLCLKRSLRRWAASPGLIRQVLNEPWNRPS